MLKYCAIALLLFQLDTITALVLNVPSSTIREVTIGGTIAEITRTFNLHDVPNGLHSVVIDHLPSTVDEKSIQVAGLGDAEVVSTTVENQVIARELDKEFAELVSTLKRVYTKLTEGLHSLTLEHRRVYGRIASLDSYVQDVMRTSVSRTTPLTLDQLTATLDYQEKALGDLTEKILALDQKINATQNVVATLVTINDKLQKHGLYQNLFLPTSALNIAAEMLDSIKRLPSSERVWPSSVPTKQLHINIHVPGTTVVKTLAFTLGYMTSPASWQAEYDLRLDSPADSISTATSSTPSKEYKLRVGMYASVAQSSRDDWTDVQLRLSTSQPQQYIYPLPSPLRTSITFQVDQPESMHYDGAVGSRVGGGNMKMMSRSRSFDQIELMSVGVAAAAPVMQDMSIAEAGMTGQAGSLGSCVVFTPSHRVNISSNQRANGNNGNSGNNGNYGNYAHHQHQHNILTSAPTTSTRLFIKEFSLSPQVFTYAIPTMHTAGLRAWVLNKDNNGKADSVPLLDSPHGRVFIDGTYTGSTNIAATQPGSPVRLELGADRNIQVSSTFVLPRQGSQSEDKAGWFVNDKIKYQVEILECAITVRSTHAAPHLVILSEYLPHVGEEGIKVELLKPAKEDILQVNGDAAHQDVWSEQDFVAEVLAHPKLAKPADKAPKSDKMYVFVSEGSHNIVYAQWVQPGQTLQTGLKYRITWSDGKNINKQALY
eukprot:CAMPEP_0184970786 /NCGR_PEP_ID=MMETSP1098-20130426/3135_1 /TAXON_ID=89044 /ORGANISM="Spumella elongata, Strain CCAP 955/1" /LENGTH=711 /DNA_ID=CAMNT_0027492765 /DNA_START=79 /DNA_END=2214 /DNA_ORIENTATION=-